MPTDLTAFQCPLRYDGSTAILTADTGHEVRLHRRRLEQIQTLFPGPSNKLHVWPNGEYPQVKILGSSPDGEDAHVGLAAIVVALSLIEQADRDGLPFPGPGWTAELDPSDRLDFRDERLAVEQKPQPNTCLLDNLAERLRLIAEGVDPDAEFDRRKLERLREARARRKAARKSRRRTPLMGGGA